jgi:hypothetical protein
MTTPIVHVLVARTRLTGNLRIGAPRSGALRVTTTAERLLRAASSRVETAFTWTLNFAVPLGTPTRGSAPDRVLNPDGDEPVQPTNSAESRPCIARQQPGVSFAGHRILRRSTSSSLGREHNVRGAHILLNVLARFMARL